MEEFRCVRNAYGCYQSPRKPPGVGHEGKKGGQGNRKVGQPWDTGKTLERLKRLPMLFANFVQTVTVTMIVIVCITFRSDGVERRSVICLTSDWHFCRNVLPSLLEGRKLVGVDEG